MSFVAGREHSVTDKEACASSRIRRIKVGKNGPYHVEGDVPLVIKSQIVSELGEPLTWQKDGNIPVSEAGYALCRCGKTGNPPFCDGSHRAGFDGTESAPTGPVSERGYQLPAGTHIQVAKDPALCNLSGYCILRSGTIQQLMGKTDDTQVRALVMAMVERCPSGSLTFSIERRGPDIEPDLPVQVATTTEITTDGPIAGPLWVTGGIPVERSDGEPLETRNRVTLCACGHSKCKPLCDGTHRDREQREARRKRVLGRLFKGR